jgi:predicted metalloprotease with PDZ domain
MRRTLALGLAAVLLALAPSIRAADGFEYRFSFPEPEHRWMQVEATFRDLGAAPLELRMSISSPGRYSAHNFAKNVYDVRAYGPDRKELSVVRSDPHGWRVSTHAGTVTVRYKIFGDHVDGTYLAIDSSHAHINMPAAVMFARGFDDRSAVLTFEPPMGRTDWRVATQLMPGAGPFEFTAPNLQYLMDSPTEFGPVAIEQFQVDGRTFRVAAHHAGTADELSGFVRDVERIVREQKAIFGEYPVYEPGHYTFLADYLPYANGDGMEHRNSTVVTSSGSIASHRRALLGTVSHEFFHNWNVERIRPRSLEPFNFETTNMSAELWLAEGFTQYYGPLTLSRAGLEDVRATATALGELVASVVLSPAHLVRPATEMSRMAPFTDGGRAIDRTNWSITYTSYYPFGGAIALALDLSLRERSSNRTSLDDLMRALWRDFGKPGGGRPGYVDRPYTLADVETRLGEISGSTEFAREFFSKYIDGHNVPDYDRLMRQAGLVLRRTRGGHAWIGHVGFEPGRHGAKLMAAPAPGTPIYAAGLDRDDELVELGGVRTPASQQVAEVLRMHKPGERLSVVAIDRSGQRRMTTMTVGEDPSFELIPVESSGGSLTDAQRAFRRRWLESQQ